MVYHNKRGSVRAIDNVDFRVGTGEFVCVIGPSGCGKTTLLRLTGGLVQPTGGKVLLDGEDPAVALSKRRIGFVFQNITLLKWRTVHENVTLPVEIIREQGSSSGALLTKDGATHLLDLVGLREFRDRYPRELSGGMQQRVALARVLSFDPDVLLMDEPFGALDGLTRQRMQMLVLDVWRKTKQTVIFVTHDIHEAIYLADRIVVLSPRPAKKVADIEIRLPRPRKRALRLSDVFQRYEEELWDHLVSE
jgi:NitT/TauT family transport system ATP-binding protein